MYRPRVPNEIRARPRIADEELLRQHVSLQMVAGVAGSHHVARVVGAAVRERIDVIQRRAIDLEGLGAIHAASSAVPHRAALERALEMPGSDTVAPEAAAKAWKNEPASAVPRHCTSLNAKRPAPTGVVGAGRFSGDERPASTRSHRACLPASCRRRWCCRSIMGLVLAISYQLSAISYSTFETLQRAHPAEQPPARSLTADSYL